MAVKKPIDTSAVLTLVRKITLKPPSVSSVVRSGISYRFNLHIVQLSYHTSGGPYCQRVVPNYRPFGDKRTRSDEAISAH